LLFQSGKVSLDFADVWQNGLLKIVNSHMETVLKVIVKLVDLNPSLILECLLIIINDVKLVLVVLEKHSAMVNQVSHIALQVEHDATDFLNDLIDGENLMAHLLELRGAFCTDPNASCFVQVSNLIHVMIWAWVSNACSPGHASGHCAC
jgi:hypothetical protein